MRIAKHTGGRNEGILREGEDISYTIALNGRENANFQHIVEGWLDALELHELKSQDYSERDEPGAVWSLGIRGEWPGFTRKIQKLHRIIWKGKDVLFEGGQEIIMDAMGALGLMLHEQRGVSDKYSASWRDNHGNKPTFGPGPAAAMAQGKEYRTIPGVGTEEAYQGKWSGGAPIIPRTTEPTGIEHHHEFIGRPSACVCGELNPELGKFARITANDERHAGVDPNWGERSGG